MTSIAIMQPTFLPWIGYFALIDRVDRFVFLDNVQFDKRSWQQRNQIKTANGPVWLSVPVNSKGRRGQLIRDVEIQHDGAPLDNIIKSIIHNYKKAPFFEAYFPAIEQIFAASPAKLQDLNEGLIVHLCNILDIQTPLCRASDLDVSGAKADLLVDICNKQVASLYVSPPGSKAYIDESAAFSDAGIDVVYHDYTHPEYAQLYGDFAPYMCILDLLFNEGAKSLEIIRSGVSA